MTKSLPIDYYPAPVPTDPAELPRYIDQELSRIRNALIAQPVALTITETSTINVTTTPNWQRLFQIDEPSWEVPGGTWNRLTAEWICPAIGLYQAIVDLRVAPYGSGNKVYYAGIRLYTEPVGEVATFIEAVDSGDDAFRLGVTLPVQIPLAQGTKVWVEGTVVHDQFVGTTTADSSLQLFRVSS